MKLPQISEAEYEVMKIIWKHAPISTNQVTDILCRTTDWSPKTVQTMLKRLVTKGVLCYVKTQPDVCLFSCFSEEDYLRLKKFQFS